MSLPFNKNGNLNSIWHAEYCPNDQNTNNSDFRLWKQESFEVYTKMSDTSISSNYWRQFNNGFGAYTAKIDMVKTLYYWHANNLACTFWAVYIQITTHFSTVSAAFSWDRPVSITWKLLLFFSGFLTKNHALHSIFHCCYLIEAHHFTTQSKRNQNNQYILMSHFVLNFARTSPQTYNNIWPKRKAQH